jgi:hypothetical protein
MWNNFEHLKETNMTYYEHMLRSLTLSKELFIGSIKAVIHAIYPDMFTSSTTELVKNLQNILLKYSTQEKKEKEKHEKEIQTETQNEKQTEKQEKTNNELIK